MTGAGRGDRFGSRRGSRRRGVAGARAGVRACAAVGAGIGVAVTRAVTVGRDGGGNGVGRGLGRRFQVQAALFAKIGPVKILIFALRAGHLSDFRMPAASSFPFFAPRARKGFVGAGKTLEKISNRGVGYGIVWTSSGKKPLAKKGSNLGLRLVGVPGSDACSRLA